MKIIRIYSRFPSQAERYKSAGILESDPISKLHPLAGENVTIVA